ncbi:MAG TPA: hypothetical protein VFN67_30125 [Polyangiales bacterium]|nr:hypothetical protein [Polyangiales bacterium]
MHDAGAVSKPPQPTDAGTPLQTQSFPSAYAMLTAVQDDAADGGVQLRAEAWFSQTVEGVDFQIKLQGCAGETMVPLAILQASDCSLRNLRGPTWSDGRGMGLPSLHCAGTGFGQGATGYERSAKHKAAWSIADGKDSDLVGHALVVKDPETEQVLACGVIRRAADRGRKPLPPADQAPTLETRAAIGGVCIARQFAAASRKCPDNEALVACQAVHCDLAQCLDTCAQYTACLDGQSDDVCSITNGCQPSPECAMCQNQMQQCAFNFCAEHVMCGATPTPDGPCQRLSGCCALQGTETGVCFGLLLPFLASWGGDGNCLGTMMDWDVVSHMHVPCTFGPGEPSSFSAPPQPQSAEPKLADDHAGKRCEQDADCPGGNCAEAAAGGGGFCTRACEVTSECGHGGMCSGGTSTEGKLCLASCEVQGDCRAGFVCSSHLEGSGLSVPGACSPKRQADQLSDNTAGRACERNEECSGGQCAKTNLIGTSYPGNYCTARCYEDVHCGKGGVCLWTHQSADPGYCLQACAGDADCTRDDYGCWELGDGTRLLHGCYPRNRPLPDGRAGQACASDADCGAPHAKCATEIAYSGLVTNDLQPAPGGYCTQPCALDIECGAGAQCINSGSSGGRCFASCGKDKPCREGYECFAHSRDNDLTSAVCVAPGP